jgi:hypothetical protein
MCCILDGPQYAFTGPQYAHWALRMGDEGPFFLKSFFMPRTISYVRQAGEDTGIHSVGAYWCGTSSAARALILGVLQSRCNSDSPLYEQQARSTNMARCATKGPVAQFCVMPAVPALPSLPSRQGASSLSCPACGDEVCFVTVHS